MIKLKILILSTAVLAVATSQSLAFPVNSTPDWKSYMQTGNVGDIVSSPTVANAIGDKVDATNGQAQGINIHAGFIDATTQINGKAASLLLQLNDAGLLSLPYATYGAPLSGSNLGTGAFSFIAPNPTIQGSLGIVGMSPIIHLRPINAYSSFDIWADQNGNAQFSTGRKGAGYSFYTSGGSFDYHGTGEGDSARINLYGYGNASPASIWQDSAGGLYIAPGSANGSTSIYANGTGGVAVYSNTLQLHGNSGAQLQFYGSDTSAHATVWQDNDKNLNISTDSSDGYINMYATKGVAMKTSVIMPTGTPASSTESCTQGRMEVDDNNIYVCTSSSVWKKTPLGAM